MKSLNRKSTLVASILLAAISTPAMSQTFTAGNATANIPSTNNTVDITYAAGNGVIIADTRAVLPNAAGRLANITPQIFDAATSTWVNCAAPPGTTINAGTVIRTCTNAGRFRLEEALGGTLPAVAAGAFRVRFDVVAAATAGSEPVNFVPLCTAGTFPPNCSEFTNAGGATTGTLTPGTITVALGPQPRYTSTPTPGTAVLITDAIGGGASTVTLTVTNSGLAGAGALAVGAPSGLSGVLAIAPSTAQNIAQGANQAYTISCTATAVGDTLQTLTITHNGEAAGGGAASPVTHQVTCRGVNVDTPPTVSLGAPTQPPAGPINVAAAGSVALNVDSAGAPTASVTVNCTFPTPGPANFSVTGGGTRTINAPATTGPNAPAIGVQCTRQAAAATATLSCARTTVPASSLAPLTVDFTCPAGTTAPNPGVNPASGSTIAFSGPPASVVSNGVTFTNTGGTATYAVNSCTLGGASASSFAVTSTFPITVATNGSANVGLTCTTPASPGAPATATLTCATSDTAFSPTFNLSCQSLVVAVPAMGIGGKALMILLVLGFGLVGFQLYRRTA